MNSPKSRPARFSSLPALGAGFFSLCLACQAAPGTNLLPNGGFDQVNPGTRAPAGWTLMISDNQVAAASGGAVIGTEKREGNAVLKVYRPEIAGTTICEAQVAIPDGVKRVRVSFRYKSDAITLGAAEHNGNGAGIYVYLDKARGQAEDHVCVRWVGGMMTTPWQEWSRVEREFDVPATHRELRLHLIFLGATGTFYYDDVEVTPVG